MVEYGDIQLKDVFIPDRNKLTYATNFQKGTNLILQESRIHVAWMVAGVCSGAYETALKYCLEREQFGREIASFQLIQEKLSRMLMFCEGIIAHCVRITELFMQGKCTFGQISRLKANSTLLAREITRLAREVCGGNGILSDNGVMMKLIDIEGMYTYEGTYEVNSLISGRELTGGINAFVS